MRKKLSKTLRHYFRLNNYHNLHLFMMADFDNQLQE